MKKMTQTAAKKGYVEQVFNMFKHAFEARGHEEQIERLSMGDNTITYHLPSDFFIGSECPEMTIEMKFTIKR